MLPAIMMQHTDSPLQFFSIISETTVVPGMGLSFLDAGFQLSYQNQTFEDAFVHYGKILMTHFSDRVAI